MEQEIARYFWSLKDTLFFDIFQVISGKLYIFLTCSAFVVYAFARLKKKVLIFILAAGISVAASDALCYRVLKPVFKKPRPSVALALNGTQNNLNQNKPLNKKNYSMPSNHASNIFAFFIVYFCYVKKFWGLPFLNSVLISASRIILVKHYPTDVFTGIIVGIVLGLSVVYLFSLFGFKPNLIKKE